MGEMPANGIDTRSAAQRGSRRRDGGSYEEESAEYNRHIELR